MAPLSALLVASVGWNVWYYRLEQKRRVQAMAEERASKAAVALAKEEAERAKLKRQLRDAKSAGRIQQLYEEINRFDSRRRGILLAWQKCSKRKCGGRRTGEKYADTP